MINVLITGAGSVMGQSIYKALVLSGTEMKIFFANSDALGAGLYFPDVERLSLPLASSNNYLQEVDQLVQNHKIDIIFPGTQHELSQLAVYNMTNPIVTALPPHILQIALDKFKTGVFFEKYNITHPKTTLLKDTIVVGNSSLIVKPKTNSASRNIHHIHTTPELEELRATLDQEEYICQEYLAGEEYTCGCYIDRYTKQISTIIFKRSLTPDGASGHGLVVDNKEIVDYVKQIGLGFIKEGMDFGHLNIQLRLTSAGPQCFEINGRLSSTEAPKAVLGFNSVAAFVDNIVFQTTYSSFSPVIGKQFLRYYEEVYF